MSHPPGVAAGVPAWRECARERGLQHVGRGRRGRGAEVARRLEVDRLLGVTVVRRPEVGPLEGAACSVGRRIVRGQPLGLPIRG